MARRPSLDYAAGGIIDQLRQQRREEDQGRTQRLNMAIAGIVKGLETGGQLWEKQREKKLAELQRLAPMAAIQVMETESQAPKDLIGRLGQERVQDIEKKYGYPEQDPISRIAPDVSAQKPVIDPARERRIAGETMDRFVRGEEELLEGDYAEILGADLLDSDYVPPSRPAEPVAQEAAPPGYPVPPPGHAEESWRRSAGEFGGKRITKEGFEQALGEAQGQYATEAANALAKQLDVTPEQAKREIEVARFLLLKEGAAQAAALEKEKRGYRRKKQLQDEKLKSSEKIAGMKTGAQKFATKTELELLKIKNAHDATQRKLDRQLERDLDKVKEGDGSPKIEMEIDKTIDKKIAGYNSLFQRTWAAIAADMTKNTVDSNRFLTLYGMQILDWEKYKKDRKTTSVPEPKTPTPKEVDAYMERAKLGEVTDWNYDAERAE